MFGRDTFARIGYGKDAFITLLTPGKCDFSAIGGVANSVRHQVTQRTTDFLQIAFQPGLAVQLQLNVVPATTQ